MLDEHCVGYIPMRLREFRPALKVAAELKPGGRFLDVGCGIGTKMLLAQRAGLEAFGVEIRPRYALCAHTIAPKSTIWISDVRELDIRWDAFDIVFCYSPLDEPYESELEVRIAREMRSDAVFLLAYRHAPASWSKVAEHVWIHN